VNVTALWRKTALKAALSPVNLTAGLAAAAAAVWLRSPWPLAVWAVFAVVWVLAGSRSARYRDAALADVRKASEVREVGERAALAQRVEAQLQEPPLRGWVQAGMLPDYLRIYRRLVEIRERVVRVARERAEVEALTREEMIGQLDGMLTSYLHFVRERVNYLQILNNIRSEGDADGVSPGVAAVPSASTSGTGGTGSPPPAGFEGGRWVAVGKVAPKSGAPRPVAPTSEAPGLPSFERRLAEVEGKIARLRELAEQEPVTASTREWHIGILEKQRDLLRECRERDQRVVAQLGVFTDVFEIILGRVSAAQFSPTEIVGTMAPVVEQIEETERFIATLRPAMDELMGRPGGV
jgi:hypothetical protein